MSDSRYRRFYWCSLLMIAAVSVYPIFMGVKVFLLYLAEGMVPVEDYPKYVIPYTPMCIALILVTAVYPLLYRRFRGKALPVASVLGIILFFIGERGFERIPVLEGYEQLPLESWQYALCYATPEVLKSIGEPIYAENNPAFKVHFYLIVMVIVLTVTGLIHGYTQMIKENDTSKRRSLLAQTVCVVLFVGFCILACFTAFFRNGTIYISPLSSVLTGGFFVLFGATAGVYTQTLVWQKVWPPVAAAVLTTTAMYIGELVLMGGELFRFGTGIFFERLGVIPFSLCDMVIILAAGAVTRGIQRWLHS